MERVTTTEYQPDDITEFNPADLENLVRFVVQELESRNLYPLLLPAPFDGAGIYALYYDGEFPLYQHPSIRSPDKSQPIYVGRARFTSSSGPRPLYRRLREHAESIDQVENLSLEDFSCRFLVLHPIWVSTVEDLLINHFDTLWNGPIKGFGLHDPGRMRHGGEISLWDSLHPGRRHQRLMAERGAIITPLSDIERLINAFRARRDKFSKSGKISRTEVEQSLRKISTQDEE